VAERGTPVYLIMDNGDEFISYSLERWAEEMGMTLYIIDSGSPWQNGKCESFNSRLRDELLNVELFSSVTEAQLLTNKGCHDYNQYRAHSSLGYSNPHEFMAHDMALT
jgi:putative transposase